PGRETSASHLSIPHGANAELYFFAKGSGYIGKHTAEERRQLRTGGVHCDPRLQSADDPEHASGSVLPGGWKYDLRRQEVGMLQSRQFEGCRKHANDPGWRSIEQQPFANDLLVASKATVPDTIAEHHLARRTGV